MGFLTGAFSGASQVGITPASTSNIRPRGRRSCRGSPYVVPSVQLHASRPILSIPQWMLSADRVGRPLVLVWLQQSLAFVHAFASVKAIRRNVKSVSLGRFA